MQGLYMFTNLTSADGRFTRSESVGHLFGNHLIQQLIRSLHFLVKLTNAILQFLAFSLLLEKRSGIGGVPAIWDEGGDNTFSFPSATLVLDHDVT